MSCREAMNDETDLEHRDPHAIVEDLLVSFEDVLAEPEHTQSTECAWKCAYRCFRVWKIIVYAVFTTLCGWACGCFWGCYFGGISIWYIWIYNPSARVFTICLNAYGKLCVAYYDATVGAYCSAVGRVFDAFRNSDIAQKL